MWLCVPLLYLSPGDYILGRETPTGTAPDTLFGTRLTAGLCNVGWNLTETLGVQTLRD